MTFTPNGMQRAAIERLRAEGFHLSNSYSDRVVRMERALPNGDCLYTFIRNDGSYRPPRCWESTIEMATA